MAVGCPKEKVALGASEVVAGSTGAPKLKLNGVASLAAEVPAVASTATGGSVEAGSDACAGWSASNVKGDGASFGDTAASGSFSAAEGTGGANDDTAVSVVVVAPNNGAVEVEGAPNREVPPDVEDTSAEGTDGDAVGAETGCSVVADSSTPVFCSLTVTI